MPALSLRVDGTRTMTKEYPTSSATEVIWIGENGSLTITVIYVSPGEENSTAAKQLLEAAVEDANESVVPVLNEVVATIEDQSDDSKTDLTYEERLGVGEADLTLRVIVEIPDIEISSLSLFQLLGRIINGSIFQGTWELLDPSDYRLRHEAAAEEPEQEAEFDGESVYVMDDGRIAIPATSIRPTTPRELFACN